VEELITDREDVPINEEIETTTTTTTTKKVVFLNHIEY
jgi:hypothetical protein